MATFGLGAEIQLSTGLYIIIVLVRVVACSLFGLLASIQEHLIMFYMYSAHILSQIVKGNK